MESNESSEDRNLDNSKEMKISDCMEDKKSENESDKAGSGNLMLEENERNENENDTSKKTYETEKIIIESENMDSLTKINSSVHQCVTMQEDEKNTENNSVKASDAVQLVTESTKEATSIPITSVTLKDTKESKRKRKSTNTPLVRGSPVEQQQNGGGSGDMMANKRRRPETKSDRFCWRCHKESVEAKCSACPRSWHRRCMGGAPPLSVINWICGECAGILQAENAETRSHAMAQLTVDQLCMMLKHVVERMRDQHGSEPFWKAVDLNEVPNYLEYVVKPMDLSLLESNVRAKLYGSTDAFMADARWIQHNCIVFNTYTSKLTNTAKQMLKVARQEVSEIEACPDCFAHGRNLPRPLPSWFVEPCRRPHPIVWAKLKGFPFWPAKAMPRLNTQGLVDVRFFGEHDRAWVSPKDIYLYSQEPPVGLPKKKKLEMEQCVKEVEEHSKKLEQVFGEFRYATPKIQYDPHDPMQIKLLLPNYDPLKNSRAVTPKTDIPQTPVNNKAIPPKVDKKLQSELKSTTAASTNGVTESPAEKRKLVRKKKTLDSPQTSPVNKESPEIETIIVNPTSKSKSRSPPAVSTPLVNSNINEEKSKSRSPESPEITAILEVSKNGPLKKNITHVRRLKSDIVNKRLSSAGELNSQDEPLSKKANVVTKNVNGKPATIVHSMPALNSLHTHSDKTKPVSSSQKPKTIYIHPNMKKSTNLVPVNSKFIVRSPQSENRLGNKGLNKSSNKEIMKFPVGHAQKNKDDLLSSNKPMTAIPVSAKKDQKAMYLTMNSNTSESAKHFSEKDARLSAPITTIKQEPKDTDISPKLSIVRKPGKARKSFPNKPPSFPQMMAPTTSVIPPSSSLSSSYPLTKATSASDAMVYIPPQSSDLRSSSYELPPPEAGPVTAQIHHNSKELANRVAQLIVDTIKDAAESNVVGGSNVVNQHEATIHYLKLRMERLKWKHQQEIAELKHNNELVLRELKASMEVERFRAIQDTRREAEIDKARCIEETKRKQWCVVCGREAMFYCCWNTAYCDYPCQQKHWASHIGTCAQKSQSQSQPEQSIQQQKGNSSQTPLSSSTLKVQQQVMPTLVINRPQQSSSLRRA